MCVYRKVHVPLMAVETGLFTDFSAPLIFFIAIMMSWYVLCLGNRILYL